MADGLRARLLATLGRLLGSPGAEPFRERLERRIRALRAEPAGEVEGSSPGDGFVMQGPVGEDTEKALACLRRLYPREKVVLSSWQDSDAGLLGRLRPYCDAVVLSTPPAKRGGSNRNYQIVSTNAGLKQARELGVQTVIKTRTDICLMAPSLFSLYRLVEPRVDRRQVEARGLAGRIFVPQTYTKKYFPYHVSDIVMLGHLPDLAAFWDVPLDERELAPEDYSWGRNSLERIGEEALLPECYLGRRYAERLQLAGEPDALSAYWRLLRDFFVVVDDSWFDLYWLKRPQHLQPRAVDELVSHQFWQTLYFGLTLPAAVWHADLAAARSEGATFEFREPPRISGAAGTKR